MGVDDMWNVSISVIEFQSHYESRLKEFLLWLRGERTPVSIHEDTGLVPGLAQWVKDLGLP